MSRSYKKPFVKMAKEAHAGKKRKEGDCWGWPSEGVKLPISDPKGIRK